MGSKKTAFINRQGVSMDNIVNSYKSNKPDLQIEELAPELESQISSVHNFEKRSLLPDKTIQNHVAATPS